MQKNIIKYILTFALLFLVSCKDRIEEKPFVFNGQNFHTLVINSLSGDENSKIILEGLFTFDAPLKTFNKIDIDSIEINNENYYTLILENQNPVYNLFAIIDKDLNLIIKDESLNGYINLNFKKSGSRRFAVITEDFNSKDVVQLRRISYYILEQYSSMLAFRQFTKFSSPSKEAEQVVSIISDTAIITNINNLSAKSSKTYKDIFRFDIANNKYISNKNLFDSLIYKEVRSVNVKFKNPQITNGESILSFISNKGSSISIIQAKLQESDFEIDLNSTWNKLDNITISDFVKKNLKGTKYISGKMGASISLAAIATTDSAENYFNEDLKNKTKFASEVRYSDKFIDNKNIYQLYEFSCPSKKILMILETPKSTYELNKNQYEQIIKTFLIKC